MEAVVQILWAGAVVGFVYGMVALGFTIVYNATHVINFAQGEFVMMGGLIAAHLSQRGVPMPAIFGIAVVSVTVLGILLDKAALQHARQKTVLTLIMITIGASIAFKGLMQVLIGRDIYFMQPFPGIDSVTVGGVHFASQGFYVILTLGLFTAILTAFFEYTRLGKAMRAASENPRAAALCGIDSARMSTLAYAIAAALGAIAGIVLTPLTSAFYENGVFFGLKGFAAAILGGLGNPLGALVGGLLVGVFESTAAGFVSSAYKDSLALALLLGLLFVRPQGLLGRAEAKRV